MSNSIAKNIKYLTLIALSIGLFSCNGMFDGLYDDEVPNTQSDFTEKTVTVDASEYTNWVYINFHNKTTQTVAITTDSAGNANYEEPAEWDIAIHRFQAKTNGGSAMETQYSTIEELQNSGVMPTDTLKEDVWYDNKVITDLSGMMSGNIKYCPSNVNDVLTSWISSTGMPPVYTTSDKVYIVKFADGTYLALRLENYMDNSGNKGYMTYSYVYPLTFE